MTEPSQDPQKTIGEEVPSTKRVELDEQDFDFISESKEATLMKKTPYANALLWILGAIVIVGLTWAYFATLDEITVGDAKVIPTSQVKVIQNLEGGILKKILVKEGEVVEPGQVLALLDDTRFSSDYREGQARYLVLKASVARLSAELKGESKVAYPEDVIKGDPDIIRVENELFKARRQTLESNLATLEKSYKLTKQEYNITKPLVDEGIVSKIELLRLEKQVNELKGSIDDRKEKFQEETQAEMNKKKGELTSLGEALKSLRDRMVRTTIKSPVRGIVKQINISTRGGVIKPGMDIMEIVPLEDTLRVEAEISPKDIAFIHPGQDATVKITAYDFSIYGGLKGKVEHISADTSKDEKDVPYYEVWITTDKNYLGTKQNPLPIIPGMVATVHIITGEKTILDYLLKPILKAKQNALRER